MAPCQHKFTFGPCNLVLQNKIADKSLAGKPTHNSMGYTIITLVCVHKDPLKYTFNFAHSMIPI